eukprot:5076926-Pleurochrysis_carterae.AAC.3
MKTAGSVLKRTEVLPYGGALRQRLRQRHDVEGRPAWVAMKFLEHRIPNITESQSTARKNARPQNRTACKCHVEIQ